MKRKRGVMASKLGWSREDHDKEAMVTENRRREQDRMMKEDEKTIASERKSELDRRDEWTKRWDG